MSKRATCGAGLNAMSVNAKTAFLNAHNQRRKQEGQNLVNLVCIKIHYCDKKDLSSIFSIRILHIMWSKFCCLYDTLSSDLGLG